jgi:F0F1-type ATP synthase delta subunit
MDVGRITMIPRQKKHKKIRFNCELTKDIIEYINQLLQLGIFRSKIHAIEEILHNYIHTHPLPSPK